MKIVQKDGKIDISLTKKELIKIYYDLDSAAIALEGCEDSDFREDTYKLIFLLKKVVKRVQ